ncbi:transcriptional regulator GcvA [Pseudoprimorskyibacter insulae]|uniref:Glycine cleavage system transcriptional activator n=1 Tax=Pseudoprimorskyibacter insulae TaxID=1695997 RepID=A0A2R8AP51_9RHOB|nr:transcriptional regulator GcvA [Pseudoprimorskyibacter insulae]SPF77649.1 Glycine cleavage system transcriptional activator [Pseudoprimorskyibacter insulae]
MSDRLPPLTALRAFDAAARHMSFAKAADELSVTPAALSFQIKSLETHLGAPVFRRLNRAVELTPAGEKLADALRDGFDRITAGWRAALRETRGKSLTVTAGPVITAKWLAPRIFEFARNHPGIELRFAASIRRMDFARDDVDAAIRFGTGPDEGLYSHPLLAEWVSPAMTPALAEKYKTPGSLLQAPLIVDESLEFLSPVPDWTAWFKANGMTVAAPSGARFSQADHAMDAALAGTGVLLARRSLAAHDLHSGRLVAPFDVAVSTKGQLRFVCPQSATKRPEVEAFLAWVLSETELGASTWTDKTVVAVEGL